MNRLYVDPEDMYVDHICRGARQMDQRTGQYLFNHLPEGPASVVSGKLFDPFHKELSPLELKSWINSHLMFDGNRIIAVFNNDKILWEEE